MKSTKQLIRERLEAMPGAVWGPGKCGLCRRTTSPVLMHRVTVDGSTFPVAACGRCATREANPMLERQKLARRVRDLAARTLDLEAEAVALMGNTNGVQAQLYAARAALTEATRALLGQMDSPGQPR